MRVATWCVDSITRRLPYLCHWLRRRKPDLVALQKTFAAADRIPTEALQQAGYESAFHIREGEFRNGWGVAVLNRKTLPRPSVLQEGLPGQQDRGARLLTVGVGNLEFSSVYAPYGNPGKHGIAEAVERKIAWMRLLRKHVASRSVRLRKCILAGDFNVVTDGPSRKGTLNYTEAERDELAALLDLGFIDLYCHRYPDGRNGNNYDFNIRNPVSSRLHRILGTECIARQVCDAWVDLEYRRGIEELQGCAWAQAAPVIVDLSGDL